MRYIRKEWWIGFGQTFQLRWAVDGFHTRKALEADGPCALTAIL